MVTLFHVCEEMITEVASMPTLNLSHRTTKYYTTVMFVDLTILHTRYTGTLMVHICIKHHTPVCDNSLVTSTKQSKSTF